MARYARISAISPHHLYQYQPGVSLERQLQNIKDFWDAQLENVVHQENDLIVLPEVCDTLEGAPNEVSNEFIHFKGYQMREHLAQIAQVYQTNIAYCADIALPDGTMRNMTQFINRSGGVDGEYRKNFVTIDESTNRGVLFGKETHIIQTDFARITGAICFDLNFTDLLERTAVLRPELVVYSGYYHGGLMRNYWAYACRAWFVAAGDTQLLNSAIINPLGIQMAESTEYYPFVTSDINLDYTVAHLDYNREKLAAARKKYGKKIRILDPGHLGCVLITSECDEFSAADIVAEFGIELLDDYFARVHAYRANHLEP